MSAFESARALARHLHAGDTMSDGEPIIDHLIRVADAMPNDEVTRIVALLHHADWTDVSTKTIENRFGVRVARAVVAISRAGIEPDRPYYWRIGSGSDNHARIVVRACVDDLMDSSDGDRLVRWRNAALLMDQAQSTVVP